MRAIDSSSLSKYVNREGNWQRVSELLQEGCTTLELALKEVGNGIWKRVLRGELTPDIATSTYQDFIALQPFKTASQENLYTEALRVATALGISLYDALFIELARNLKVQLATSDQQQAEALRKLGVETLYIP